MPSPDPLSRPAFHFTPGDALTFRHLLNHLLALGRTGAGKTSSFNQIARAILRERSGGVILAAKVGEDLEHWRQNFRAADRSEDELIVFGPGNGWRFNFIDHVLQTGGDTREITKCLMVIGETLRANDRNGGEAADFWERERERMTYNAVEVVRLATGRVDPWDLQRFVTGLAQSPADLGTPEWKAGFHFQTLLAAERNVTGQVAAHDFELAKEAWLGEYPTLNDRTRSSITVGVLGLLHVFNTGICRQLVGRDTNCSPLDTLRGKWVLVNMPPAEYGDAGHFVAAGWKYLAQRDVLRRHAQGSDPIHVIWCDELQQHVSSYDCHYICQARSHKSAFVALTQSIHGLLATLKGRAGEHEAKLLLSNFQTKVLFALGSSEDAAFAAGLIGKSRQTFIGGSSSPTGDIWDGMLGRGQFTGSFSEQISDIVEPRFFINGLRTGGPPHFACDAIVVRGGEPFSTGQNWLPVTFSQR